MADESKTGILGHLPPLPRPALNNSVIGMGQAYRQRKGLPMLSDADIEALKAGQPMSWEEGGVVAPSAPASTTPGRNSSSIRAAAAAPSAAAAGSISEEVAKWVAQGNKWSKSTIAAEQARRGRKGLPPLNNAEMSALLGEPVEASTPAAAAAASAPGGAGGKSCQRPDQRGSCQVGRGRKEVEQVHHRRRTGAPWPQKLASPDRCGSGRSARRTRRRRSAGGRCSCGSRGQASRRGTPARCRSALSGSDGLTGGESNTYVGTPAVGTSRAAASAGVASIGPEDNDINQSRRRFAWAAFAAFMTAWFIAFFRFFLPRTLFEPATSFKIGYPADFGLGVDTKFQQKFRIWVDRTPDRIFVIYARCTHLGCTPDWKPAENKFKCPCHGSGYDSEGINFEGPAPRPMDRAKVEIAPDGQILVDVAKLYQWPKGQPSQFNDPGAFLPT